MNYKIPIVDMSGCIIEYGDRWESHRVRGDSNNLLLGRRHMGITIAILDKRMNILIQNRKHSIFDKVWSLSGDTHPRMYENGRYETLTEASQRCAMEDLGVEIDKWMDILTVTYSAIDPRNLEFCENEFLHILLARFDGPFYPNKNNVYELRWIDLDDIMAATASDLRKEPIKRKFAPWVHKVFSLPEEAIRKAFLQD